MKRVPLFLAMSLMVSFQYPATKLKIEHPVQRELAPTVPTKCFLYFHKWTTKYNLNKVYMARLFDWESGFDQYRQSKNYKIVKGRKILASVDQGLGAINSRFQDDLVIRVLHRDPKDFKVTSISDNIELSCAIIRSNLNRYHDNYTLAVVAYNAGCDVADELFLPWPIESKNEVNAVIYGIK